MKKVVICQILVIIASGLVCSFWGGKMAVITLLTLLFLLYSLAINKSNRRIIYLWVIFPILGYILYYLSKGFDNDFICNQRIWTYTGLHFVLMLVGYMTGFFLSKCKAKTVYLIILTVLTIFLHVTGNLIGFPISFMTSGIIYLIAPYIAYRFITQKLYISLIIVAPVMLLNLESWLTASINALPLTLIPICSVGIFYLSFLLRKKRIVQVVLISLYMILLVFGWYKGYDDYRQWVSVQKAKLEHDTHISYVFYDIDGNAITPACLKGKIVVIDFWSTSCGVCFREFPEFEKVFQKYKHRDDIAIFAVNLPLKRDTHETILETIKEDVNYSFPVLLAGEDVDYWEKFKIKGVPHLMIIDKTGKVVFNGWVNYDKKIVFNIENMIDDLLRHDDQY